MVDGEPPLALGFGGGVSLRFGGLAPAEDGGGGGERGHVPPVEAAVVGIERAGGELGDDASRPELGDDRPSRLADFLVAEVGGCGGDADLVLFERLAGERGITAGVAGLRGPAWEGKDAVVLFLDQDPAAGGADQPAVDLRNGQAGRDRTVMPYVLDGRLAHALLLIKVTARSRPPVRDDLFLILSCRLGCRVALAAR